MAQGQHFLQIPGPSPVPERIQRAIDHQVIDHRGPEFQKLGHQVLAGIRPIFGTTQPVIIYPASGTGAWEAAIVNTLSPGDKVLMAETGQFATLWRALAGRFGINVDFLPGDWRHGVDASAIEAKLAEDKAHTITAVMVVPGDMALLTPADLTALIAAYAGAKGSILVPFHQGQRGSPILFAAFHIPQVTAGGMNIGCRHLIESHAEEVAQVEFERDVYTFDCDTPDDYAALLARLEGAVP